jgi:hypothetical protein
MCYGGSSYGLCAGSPTCQQGPPHRVLLFDFVATLCMVIDGFRGMPRNCSQLPYGELEGQSGHGGRRSPTLKPLRD